MQNQTVDPELITQPYFADNGVLAFVSDPVIAGEVDEVRSVRHDPLYGTAQECAPERVYLGRGGHLALPLQRVVRKYLNRFASQRVRPLHRAVQPAGNGYMGA
jgi:hypothetical protein